MELNSRVKYLHVFKYYQACLGMPIVTARVQCFIRACLVIVLDFSRDMVTVSQTTIFFNLNHRPTQHGAGIGLIKNIYKLYFQNTFG